jgi:hypothetical protein
VPADTKVMPPKYAEDQPALDLKPEEQVAFLHVYGLWFMEQASLDSSSGLGRLCTLGELIKGMPTPDGRVLGLTVTPVKDTTAIPRVKGLGGFAVLGSPRRSLGSFYYSTSADMTQAVQLTEMGYEGNGFVR